MDEDLVLVVESVEVYLGVAADEDRWQMKAQPRWAQPYPYVIAIPIR